MKFVSSLLVAVVGALGFSIGMVVEHAARADLLWQAQIRGYMVDGRWLETAEVIREAGAECSGSRK